MNKSSIPVRVLIKSSLLAYTEGNNLEAARDKMCRAMQMAIVNDLAPSAVDTLLKEAANQITESDPTKSLDLISCVLTFTLHQLKANEKRNQ